MSYDLPELLRIRTSIRRWGVRALDAHDLPPLNADLSAASDHTVVVGPDPIRILLFGAGALMGYGVTSRWDAVDGRLATLVADATGRGVIVENRTVQHLTLAHTFQSLGAVGTHTFHVAVWSPGYLECTARLFASSWRRAVGAVLGDYQRTSTTPLVIIELPTLTGNHPVSIVMRRVLFAANRGLRAAAAAAKVYVVSPTPVTLRDPGEPSLDAENHRGTAQALAPTVLAVLGAADRRTAASAGAAAAG